MLKRFCVLAILSMIAVPAFADSDDNLESICKVITCSEAPGLPMSWGIHELGKSPIYSLQATISDGVDTDRLNTIFKDPYNRSDSGYNLKTMIYGREIAWQDWLDAEGPQRKFHEVGDRIVRGAGPGQARIAIEPQEASDDPPVVSSVPEYGTLGLMALGLLALSGVIRRSRYIASSR